MWLVGTALALTGLLIRVRGLRVLGPRFGEHLEPQLTYETEDWMYRYIRHPMYLGSILILAGVYLISHTVGFIYLVVTVYRMRISREEEILLTRGSFEARRQYLQYMKRTGGLLPKLKRREHES